MPENKESKGNKRKQTWVVMISTVVMLLLIAGIVAIVFQNKDKTETEHTTNINTNTNTKTNTDTDTKTNTDTSDSVLKYDGQPSMGRENAPVKIAEFGDYKCMFCHQFEMEIFPKLKKDFIDTGKVQFYFMNYTIIAQDSVNAANASEAIYDKYPDHFWDFHKLLYENQGPETDAWVTDDLLVKLAQKAVPNLDVKLFKWDISQLTYKDNVREDDEMGKAIGVKGTPTIFINGTMVPGQDTLNYDSLKEYIQKAIDGK